MKATSQLKIARITAIVLAFFLLATPPLCLLDKIYQVENGNEEPFAIKLSLIYMAGLFAIVSPFIVLCLLYAWTLKKNKLIFSIILYCLHILWTIGSVTTGGFCMLPLDILILLLLLQGLLALRKNRHLVCEPTTGINLHTYD